jgi:hypothetical protein
LAITIIPKNKDAELMGAYLFFGQILSWLPPLVFTSLNEAGIAIRVSMLSLLIFWFISVVSLQCMGPYENALRQANEAMEDSSPAYDSSPQSVEEPQSVQSSEAPSSSDGTVATSHFNSVLSPLFYRKTYPTQPHSAEEETKT